MFPYPWLEAMRRTVPMTVNVARVVAPMLPSPRELGVIRNQPLMANSPGLPGVDRRRSTHPRRMKTAGMRDGAHPMIP